MMSEDERRNAEAGQAARPRPPPNRRRDKAQLSCNLCRRRKLKCDRVRPSCGNCVRRRVESQCIFPAHSTLESGRQVEALPTTANTLERLRQLEENVVNMMQRHGPSEHVLESNALLTPGSSASNGITTDDEPMREHTGTTPDCSNWSSILQWLRNSSGSRLGNAARVEQRCSGPLLLYGCPPATSIEELLECLPPRHLVNRLISNYFNGLDLSSAIVHGPEFLKEYENFWDNPTAVAPFWLALLYAMLCTSIQFQIANPENPVLTEEVLGPSFDQYKVKVVQCLMFGGYTNGGPYAIQALMHYAIVELFVMKDADTGVWVLVGILVNVAMKMSYHRDPACFPNISPYEAEMRRRLWRSIAVLDSAISESVGVQRLMRNVNDVAEPRNLLDSDFDSNTTVLPPARPDTEPTPMLYCLAKGRALAVFGQVTDLVTASRLCPYTEVMSVDSILAKACSEVPVCYKWKPLSHSITDSAQIICRRMYLEIVYLKARMVLHLKYVVQSKNPNQHAYSRSTIFEAITRLLELHHICDEETQPSGQLFSVRWRYLIAVHQNFLLASIAACFFLEHNKSDLSHENLETLKELCRKSQGIWIRASRSSTEAMKAAEALRIALDDLGGPDISLPYQESPVPGLDPAPGGWESSYLPGYFGGFDLPFPYINLFDGLSIPPTPYTTPDTLLVPPVTGQSGHYLIHNSWVTSP
ncbi:hypothetical protein BKA67DRAFT_55672 [Truncatella angustata]|uniref:Zn(2)-C6 fungal-type domain-containing protein n=1 Tax=Truncatella angustata TaxID=152316 RepID=A0A9P8UYJ9_9PEZI|nr:uncharacterized protein BKA67DRAFT_55672 [Truncatella angustata]KAH6660548.1 hypothetical protein BKA67DRAFT_55672 [Truncatella angustata]